MDTKIAISESIADYVKTNPCSRFSDIVRAVQEDYPGTPKNNIERMIKTMLADALLIGQPWQIPMGLAVRMTYRWNYAETRRIHVPAHKTRIDPSTKVASRPVSPMDWMAHQLTVSPGQQYTQARW